MNIASPPPRPNLVDLAKGRVGSKFDVIPLRRFRGVHPVELKDALDDALASEVYQSIFGDIAVARPLIHEIVREDNPALYFWPFTSATVERLADYAAKFEKVALLGVPTLFVELKNRGLHHVELFDEDEYLLPRDTKNGFKKGDLVEELSTADFGRQFDLVIADPPWYGPEYKAWLQAAMRILKPGGTLAFVMFPEWIRNSSPAERLQLISYAAEYLVDLSVEPDLIHYETPSFEQVQLILNGLQPVNWRSADFLTGRIVDPTGIPLPEQRVRPVWEEVRVGCGRVFAREINGSADDDFITTADPKGAFLMSPSMRNPYRSRANVLSSRGHGLVCSDVQCLLGILRRLYSLENLDACLDGLPVKSRDLLRNFILDLWPRYISL